MGGKIPSYISMLRSTLSLVALGCSCLRQTVSLWQMFNKDAANDTTVDDQVIEGASKTREVALEMDRVLKDGTVEDDEIISMKEKISEILKQNNFKVISHDDSSSDNDEL